MYVLYYFQQDENGGEMEVLRTSPDKKKLKLLQQELDEKTQSEQLICNQKNMDRDKYINDFRNLLRKYMQNNLDAIRDYDVNTYRIKEFGVHWHPEYLKKYKLELIERYITQSTLHMFQIGYNDRVVRGIIDYDKITEQPPLMEPEKLVYCHNPYKYTLDNLFIVEVEEIPARL